MKIYFLISLLNVISILSCCEAQQRSGVAKDRNADAKNKNILIVYLSRTNNTKALAEIIHRKVGGDLVAIELVNPYPADYKTTVDQVARENETGFLPALKTTIDSIEKHDVIFVGFPTWGMQLPPPVKSFLSRYNLSGKTIVPFNTNAGYGVGSGFNDVKKFAKGANVLEGFSIKGGIERDGILFVMEAEKAVEAEKQIDKWLEKLKVNPPAF